MRKEIIVALKALIVLMLLALVAFQVVIVLGMGEGLTEEFGDDAKVMVVLWSCVFAFVICAQAGLIFVWRLATFATEGTIFNRRAFGAVNGMIVSVLAGLTFAVIATVTVVVTMGIGVPPMVAGVGVFIALTCLALALVVVIMRALLRQATEFQSELEEVVGCPF
ncbi:MAG: DUF2975 domain-containing protein [Actinobacteria bacterium]|nr:DUF2975 domain-containing protein [Actinomycetota bacterium]